MKFLPFENITFRTKLDAQEILKRLRNNLEPKKVFRMKGIFASSEHKPYEGSIEDQTFKIQRIIGYNNSFLPRIVGNIESGLQNTQVHVTMKLHPGVLFFILVALCFVGLLSASFLNNSQTSYSPLTALCIFISPYVIVTGAFKFESIKSKKYFTKLFEATIDDDQSNNKEFINQF